MHLLIVVIAIITLGSVTQAQQAKKIFRIGYLLSTPPSSEPTRTSAFLQGLRELGYTEGENIVIEWRSAEGKLDRLPNLAAELVSLKVDVIFVRSTAAVQAAKKATTNIPIVSVSGDPVALGLVASLPRPGGNITGLANLTPELTGKRLELLKALIPRISRVAVLWYPDNPTAALP